MSLENLAGQGLSVISDEYLSKLLFDWLSFTSKIHSVGNLITLLGLENCTFVTTKGAHGYKDKLYFEGVNIHFNGREDMGVWVELSGKGCRTFETLGNGSYEAVFDEILFNEGQMNLTRLDAAFDDRDGLLNAKKLLADTSRFNFISKFGDCVVENLILQNRKPSAGFTIYHGKKGSDTMLRIYNKAAERGLTDGTHWIRLELQLRDERAASFAKRFRAEGQSSLQNIFLGVLSNYVRYIKKPGKNSTDTNRWRWPMSDYWSKLIDGVKKVRLYEKPGMEYNEMQLEQFVFKQAGNAIQTYIDMHGYAKFLEKLKKRGVKPNPKYDFIKERYRLRNGRLSAE